jgi:phosphatidate cytidylyltransferase
MMMTNLQQHIVSALVLAAIAIGCVLAGGQFFFMLMAALCIACLYEVWRFPLPKKLKIGAMIYIVLGFASGHSMYESFGAGVFMMIASVIILTDVGAYMAGKAIGGPKLAPAISPSKTWTGSVGGILLPLVLSGAIVLASLTENWSGAKIALVFMITIAISVATQAGDLFESWLKRKAGVKDSSNLIPGHGGFFDRLDGWIAAFILAAIVDFASRHL